MGKNTGKVEEFCQSGKVGTVYVHLKICKKTHRVSSTKIQVK